MAISFRISILALLTALPLAASVAPAAAQSPAPQNRVVMQVSDNDPGKWNLALNNAKNLQADLGAKSVDIEIVAVGKLRPYYRQAADDYIRRLRRYAGRAGRALQCPHAGRPRLHQLPGSGGQA